VAATLERGYVALERLARWILAAGILVALILAKTFLYICRREVHRRHDRAGEGIRSLSSVHGTGGEAGEQIVVKYFRHADPSSGQVIGAR
jgi:hypothetical protein